MLHNDRRRCPVNANGTQRLIDKMSGPHRPLISSADSSINLNFPAADATHTQFIYFVRYTLRNEVMLAVTGPPIRHALRRRWQLSLSAFTICSQLRFTKRKHPKIIWDFNFVFGARLIGIIVQFDALAISHDSFAARFMALLGRHIYEKIYRSLDRWHSTHAYTQVHTNRQRTHTWAVQGERKKRFDLDQ